MKWVHIYRREFETGQSNIAVTCVLSDGRVELEGDEDLVVQLKQGILIPAEARTLTTEDGEAIDYEAVFYRTPAYSVRPDSDRDIQ